jgi:hypothetical protein
MARRTKKPRGSSPSRAVLRLDHRFRERRYEGKAAGSAYVWVALMCVGAVAMGAACWAMFFRDEALEPLPYMPYVLVAGAALVLAYLMFGQEGGAPVHVGVLGIGFENDDKVTRTPWCDIRKVTLGNGALRFETRDIPLTLSLTAHPDAAALALDEALKRIPDRVDVDDREIERIGAPSKGVGEELTADPPQVTTEKCRASGKPLTFEKDVRMCSRCGALYHKSGVPRSCIECDKRLKKK